MEALGGVGYLENEESQHINVARLYRDANVLSIWEGTTNVLGTDFVRTLKGRHGAKTLTAIRSWLNHALFGGSSRSNHGFADEKARISSAFQSFELEVTGKSLEELIVGARGLMDTFAALVIETLMVVDAERDGEVVAVEVFKRFAASHGSGEPYKNDCVIASGWDFKIVFGASHGATAPRL